MERITVKKAADMMNCGEQQVRVMVQLEKIPGAFCYGPKHRRTYYITDQQVRAVMEGGKSEGD